MKTQNVSSTSTSMPNLTHQTEISSTPKQSHVHQPKPSSSPPPSAIEIHKSADPELTEPHLLVQAAQELKSEGQLPW